MNNTSYQLDGYQTDSNGPPVEIGAVIFGLLVIILAIFANTSIIICFIINRRKIWPCFSTQILSLCVSDMFVGYASLPLAVFPLTGVDIRVRTCVLTFYLFFASQCASLYHIFGLCIHRCIVIQNISRLDRKESNILKPLLLVILAWIASFSLCFLPTIIFGKPKTDRKGCVIDEIYEDDAQAVLDFLFIIYLVPQILTNVLYVAACVRLKYSLTKVFPSQQSSNEITSRDAQPTPIEEPTNRTKLRIQREVLGTIGLVMLIFNICTIPEVVLLKLGNDSRNVRYILSTVFVLNSALNPFVYASRTKWIRLALNKMFTDFVRNVCT